MDAWACQTSVEHTHTLDTSVIPSAACARGPRSAEGRFSEVSYSIASTRSAEARVSPLIMYSYVKSRSVRTTYTTAVQWNCKFFIFRSRYGGTGVCFWKLHLRSGQIMQVSSRLRDDITVSNRMAQIDAQVLVANFAICIDQHSLPNVSGKYRIRGFRTKWS